MKGIGHAISRVAPALLLVQCGGGSGGSPMQPSSASCRTYASQQNLTVTTSGVAGVPPVQGSGTVSCSFDRVSATLTCNSTLTIAGSFCISTSVNSSVYSTVDDFVDEGALLGRQLLMRSAVSGTTSVPGVDGGCVSVPSPPTTLNYEGDGEHTGLSKSAVFDLVRRFGPHDRLLLRAWRHRYVHLAHHIGELRCCGSADQGLDDDHRRLRDHVYEQRRGRRYGAGL